MEEYYKPEPYEFHIGFKFEQKNSKNNWQKHTVTTDFYGGDCIGGYFQEFLNDLYKDNIRVKYLDKTDLYELGFKPVTIDKTRWKIEGATMFKKTKYTLVMYGRNFSDKQMDLFNLIYIFKNDLARTPSIDRIPKQLSLFNGHIKNKSELAILFKQLKV